MTVADRSIQGARHVSYAAEMVDGLEVVVGPWVARHPRLLQRVEEAFELAREHCSTLLDARDVDVHVMAAPDECIPQWGTGGFTQGPHAVLVAVDPNHDVQTDHLISTLVHEIHHAMRWRGPGCGTSVGERLVSEGLAEAFEVQCTGREPLYAVGQVEAAARAAARRALAEDPADEGRWFFGSADVPFWFGYRWGYELVNEALPRLGLTAAEAVLVPAADVLAAVRV